MGIEVGLAALGGLMASKMLAPAMAKPTVTAPEPPPKPAQSTKAPDRVAITAANRDAAASGPMAGNSSTFLTGPSGIDPSTLNLGKNVLLGQ
jgi:hypothetical protein